MIRLSRATSDPGLSRVVELSPLLRLLDCRPGDRVLDLGGPLRFSSRLLTRFGLIAYAPAVSDFARAARSRRQAMRRPECALPYGDEAFDGVIGVGALSRVDDASSLLAEVSRVLKPGGRAVLSERPQPEPQCGWVAEWQHRLDLLHAAHRAGLRTLGRQEIAVSMAGHPLPSPSAAGPLAVFVRSGSRPLTSRRPGLLRGRIEAEALPSALRRRQSVVVRATVENTGDTVWLREASRFGGFVTIGCRLATAGGEFVNGSSRRSPLPADVPPGERARARLRFTIPATVAPGRYQLVLDLYNEMVCAFSDLAPGTACRLDVNVLPG